jgi:hypothetical protein
MTRLLNRERALTQHLMEAVSRAANLSQPTNGSRTRSKFGDGRSGNTLLIVSETAWSGITTGGNVTCRGKKSTNGHRFRDSLRI